MADIAALGISIKADGADKAAADLNKVSGAASRAQQATQGVAGSSVDASDRLRKLGQATAVLDGPLGGVASRFRSLGTLIDNTNVTMVAAALTIGALSLAFRRLVSDAIAFADTWSDLNSRVGLAIQNMDGSAAALDRLSDVARRTYSSLELSTESFIRNSAVLREMGKSTSEQLDYTEALNLALVVSGAKADRAVQVQGALGKAMALGALRGQELETVLTSGGRVAEVLAEELGVGVSQLRALGMQGKITGDVIYAALTKRLEELRGQAELMPATIGDGLLLIRNALLRVVGVYDQTNKLSETVAIGLVGIADGLETVARAAVVASVAMLAAFGPSIATVIGIVANAIRVTLVSSIQALGVAAMTNPLGFIAGTLAISITYIAQFGQETYKVGQTTLHVGNIMKAIWTTVSEAINMVISAVAGLATSLWNFVTFNWSGAVDAAKGAAQDIADSATRVADAWRQITQIPGTDRFAFAGNMSQHLSPPRAPKSNIDADEQNAFERATASIRERAIAMREETNVVGLSTFASERYLATQQLIRAAIEAGLPLNDERLRYIEEEASAYARVAAAAEEAEDAQRRLDDLRGTFQSSMSSFAQDIARGTNALDSLANSLQRVADKLIDMAVNDLFESAFGKSGTSNSFFGNLANGNSTGGLFGGTLIPGILHNGGVVGNDNYPHRAVPASAFANAPRYHNGGIAGLKPNEVPAILERGETVIPKGRGQGSVVVEITNNNDFRGVDPSMRAWIESRLEQSKRQAVSESVAAVAKTRSNNPRYMQGF